MIDTKKVEEGIRKEADSGARREAEKVARATMRIHRDGRSKPFEFTGDVEPKRRTAHIDIEGAALKFSWALIPADRWARAFGKRKRAHA